MNRTLFLSKHALLAGTVGLGLLAFGVAVGGNFGWGPEMDRGFALTSGWATLVLMLIVMAYVGRKYAHRLGYSPEFRLKVSLPKLEAAEAGINGLRQKVAQGLFKDEKSVRKAAQAVLVQTGVHKVNKVEVEGSAEDPRSWRIRVVPTEPLVRNNRWMHAHLYYGLAFGLALVLHAGLLPSSEFGLGLQGIGVWVLVTGLVGIVLWALGPSWLTRREKDLTIEAAHAISTTLERKRAGAIESLPPDLGARITALSGKAELKEQDIAATLEAGKGQDPEVTANFVDLVALLTQERLVRREYRALAKVRMSFMWWRYLHIPAAIVLGLLVVVHLWTVLKY